MELTDRQIATIFKALCDENRIKIIRALQHGEKCACHLLEEINVTQPTLSHHMKVLCECGLISTRTEAKWSHYSLNCDQWTTFRDYIESIRCTCSTDNKEKVGCCCT